VQQDDNRHPDQMARRASLLLRKIHVVSTPAVCARSRRLPQSTNFKCND
jgi:hypothetical protein